MKNIKKLVTVTLILVLCVLLYYRYANKDDQDTDNTVGDNELSEVEKILTKDLVNNYPNTPLEVVKFFTRIQKCYYNEDNTDEIVEELADQARLLMDDRLIQKNPLDEYYESLKTEIKEYKKEKRTITNILYDKTTDVVYSTVDGTRAASLNCIYYIRTGKRTASNEETYILCRDSDGRWKIYGWMLDEPTEWED
jgi:hypothetical protein